MIQALYTGASGMIANQRNLDVTANNIANVNTQGFKKARVDFKDAIYETMLDQSMDNGLNPANNLQQGNGVFVGQTKRIMTQGIPIATGRDLDFAVTDGGYFRVEDNQGNTFYTRDGAFYASPEAEGAYMVTSEGYYLTDVNGERIVLPEDMSTFNVADDGTVFTVDGEGTYTPAAEIPLYTFANQSGLVNVGGNRYAESENSGAAEILDGGKFIQGYLEGSNVDFAEETVRMIRAQRAYQLSAKVITTADMMEGLANTLRG